MGFVMWFVAAIVGADGVDKLGAHATLAPGAGEVAIGIALLVCGTWMAGE